MAESKNPVSSSSSKKGMTQDQKQRTAQTKAMAKIYDQYMRRVLSQGGKRDEKRRMRLREISEILERGSITRIVPIRNGRSIVGKQKKLMPLTPRGRLRLIAEQVRLEELVRPKVSGELRKQFLEILLKFAAHYAYTRQVLLRSGVPEADLDEVGILD